MNNQQLSEGLQILSKYFAIKTQSSDSISLSDVLPSIPDTPQSTVTLEVVHTPTTQEYEPIGRGRGPKILLASIVAVGVGYYLFRKYKLWRDETKYGKGESVMK
jgi:hypothetical protein